MKFKSVQNVLAPSVLTFYHHYKHLKITQPSMIGWTDVPALLNKQGACEQMDVLC